MGSEVMNNVGVQAQLVPCAATQWAIEQCRRGTEWMSHLISTLQSAQHQVFGLVSASSWLDMSTAPKTNTLVLLLVRFRDHPIDDQEVCVTIGANALSDTGLDSWQFAGWDWEQDRFREGEGEPIGWLPLPAAVPGHADDAAVDAFGLAMKAKLQRSREKSRGGWDKPEECSADLLADLFVSHIPKGNAGNLEDLANFCMMLHQRGDDPKVLADALERLVQRRIDDAHAQVLEAHGSLIERLQAHKEQVASL
ncbi:MULTISPECIES: hypothetical protein [unclassified Pseudomonas]|uniref:hypothetical protein n=1 Tax=unclassified Pseudomonas TaxID=196821 RepID=UPI0015B03FF5|nr:MULTISPECIES: hypothetical protein [unclassified Pseudomonas]